MIYESLESMCIESQCSFSVSYMHAEGETGRKNNVPVSPLRLLLLERVLRHGVPVAPHGEGCAGLLAIAGLQGS